jgi:phosphopantothenoylcysteine decarboxylase/phosphopantothenate--cysteine ligase
LNDHDIEKLGNHLDGKKIALLVTGSISAYKSPSIARHFRQYGAEVHVYATPNALRFVAKESLEWASNNEVIDKITYKSEHLIDYDGYVVAPASYNTINKFANGTADNAVTTTFASALNKINLSTNVDSNPKRMIIVPAMHESMANDIFEESRKKLSILGVYFDKIAFSNNKLKIKNTHEIVIETIRLLSTSNLEHKKIIVTAGPTPAKIDNVRIISNRFKGRLGVKIAEELYMRGSNVHLILGSTGLEVPSFLKDHTTKIRTFDEYYIQITKELHEGYDVGIFAAAVIDYIPATESKGKIPSQDLDFNTIPLKQTFKIIKKVREDNPNLIMVTFKYEENISKEDLLRIAENRIKNDGYQLVVANRGEEMKGREKQVAYIVDKNGVNTTVLKKSKIPIALLDVIENNFSMELAMMGNEDEEE